MLSTCNPFLHKAWMFQIYSKQASLLGEGSSITGRFQVEKVLSDSTTFSVFWSSSKETVLTVTLETTNGTILLKEDVTSPNKVWSVDLSPPTKAVTSLAYRYRYAYDKIYFAQVKSSHISVTSCSAGPLS